MGNCLLYINKKRYSDSVCSRVLVGLSRDHIISMLKDKRILNKKIMA